MVFHARLDQRLALLLRHQARDGVGAGAEQVGGLAHDLGAVVGRDLAPRREAALGGCEGFVQIGLLGVGDLADHLLRRRVEDRDRLAGARVAPLAGYVQLDIRVHGGGVLRFRGGRGRRSGRCYGQC
jgi:hypothetical protein